jgi:hypothetical protein
MCECKNQHMLGNVVSLAERMDTLLSALKCSMNILDPLDKAWYIIAVHRICPSVQ